MIETYTKLEYTRLVKISRKESPTLSLSFNMSWFEVEIIGTFRSYTHTMYMNSAIIIYVSTTGKSEIIIIYLYRLKFDIKSSFDCIFA